MGAAIHKKDCELDLASARRVIAIAKVIAIIVAKQIPKPTNQDGTTKRGRTDVGQVFLVSNIKGNDLSNITQRYGVEPQVDQTFFVKLADLYNVAPDNDLVDANSWEEFVRAFRKYFEGQVKTNTDTKQWIQRYIAGLRSRDSTANASIAEILKFCNRVQSATLTATAPKAAVLNSSNNFVLARNVLAKRFALVAAFSISAVVLISIWNWPSNGPEVRIGDPTEIKMDSAEARSRLDVLWSNGLAFDNAGNKPVEYLRAMTDAQDLALQVFGNESLEYAQSQNHMIGALWTNGHHDKSIAAAREAVRIYTKLLGPNHPDTINDEVNLGSRLSGRPDPKERGEAKQLLFGASEKYRKLPPSSRLNFLMAHNYEAISIYFLDQRQPHLAVEHSQRSIELVELADARKQIDRGWIIANHAGVLHASGDCPGAKQMFARAITAYIEASVPSSHKDHAYSIFQERQFCDSQG